MIGYVTLGSNDLAASAVFFDTLFAQLGGTRAYRLDHLIGYSFGPKNPMIVINKPHNGQSASHGNGCMVALMAKDQAQVDAVHALALSLGAQDEGAPGPRGATFYGAYFRDPDGNKFNLFLYS